MEAAKQFADVHAASSVAVGMNEIPKRSDRYDYSYHSHPCWDYRSQRPTVVPSCEPTQCFLCACTDHNAVNCPTGKPCQFFPGKSGNPNSIVGSACIIDNVHSHQCSHLGSALLTNIEATERAQRQDARFCKHIYYREPGTVICTTPQRTPL